MKEVGVWASRVSVNHPGAVGAVPVAPIISSDESDADRCRFEQRVTAPQSHCLKKARTRATNYQDRVFH
ncbi:protein of unknown function [Paraburkholderia dioscoreae]|uniref:Uncharacterized protein n=1 Tax=Paraburkholderia dioscoreae TaxID=2604047 RepID=A0A5Q4ZBI1_9BURK|nr:protein of unknown function [Paraburkholderia dioscoreae]